MIEQSKSKFIGRFDASANSINKRPAIVGSFALASGGVTYSFRAWSGVGAFNTTYLRGTHEPQSLTGAIKARFAKVAEADAPPNLVLKPGEIVLFENTRLEENLKRPNWYGYARTNDGYVRLAGWDRLGDKGTKLLAGTAEPYRPGEWNDMSSAEAEKPAP